MHIIVAITGASGYVLGHRITKALSEGGHTVSLIVSGSAEKIASVEGQQVDKTRELASNVYRPDELEAPVSSSTEMPDAMIVAPCSLKTLSSIASGYGGNLISRCAENCLRMRVPLVVMPRETPLSLMALENMRTLSLAGAVILPPVMAYYTHPATVDDITDFFVGKALDALGISHNLPGWEGL